MEMREEIRSMTMEDVKARLLEIVDEIDAEDADTEALDQEVDELNERKKQLENIAETRSALKAKVAKEGVVEKTFEERKEEKDMITIESKEYRDAFYAYIGGKATEEQRAVLATPISVDGDATNDGQAIALPKTLDEKIWDNIHTAHPILDDITTIASGIVMEVTKHTAIATRVSGKKDGAAGAGAEENTFVKVTLSGVDYEKYVELTYAEARMSQGALEDYLAQEIASELGEALAKAVFSQMKTDATTSQKVTATSDMFADVKDALALASLADNAVIYANSANYYKIVGAVSSGNPFNIGTTLGVEVKKDEATNGVVVVDPKQFVLNLVQGVTIEADKDIKSHHVIVSGYMRAQGTMRKNKAVSYIA